MTPPALLLMCVMPEKVKINDFPLFSLARIKFSILDKRFAYGIEKRRYFKTSERMVGNYLQPTVYRVIILKRIF